jgi:hypothetical protein
MKEALNKLLSDFDIAALLPDLSGLPGFVATVSRLAVMAGPLLMLIFGLIYLAAPPKEANHRAGFRCWWGMASLDAWQFTQKAAGITWTVLGAVLTIVMAFNSALFGKLAVMGVLSLALKCLFWELGLTLLTVIGINIAVIVMFDRFGYRRRER